MHFCGVGCALVLARILIAEDEPSISLMLTRIMQRAGLAVVTAADGAEALARVQDEEYDLLLLDLTMPRVSGYDVVHALRGSPRRPPVIVLTANVREDGQHLDGTVVQCILRKPFDVAVLLELVLAVAEAVHAARSCGTWVPPPAVHELLL
jgi:DNA-binding response OmpR family regulator